MIVPMVILILFVGFLLWVVSRKPIEAGMSFECLICDVRKIGRWSAIRLRNKALRSLKEQHKGHFGVRSRTWEVY